MTAGLPLNGSGSGHISIPELVSRAGDGAIRIPTFQRSFVWDATDVRRLFDSIYRGFPIGTFLLWQQVGPAGKVHLGPITLSAKRRTDALWVVDGQQRITSLFGVLAPGYEKVDDRFEVYFDLANSKFIGPRRGVVPPRALPVRETLETRSLLTWLRQHESELELSDFDRADQLAGVIRDYKIPAYIVAGDDQKLLREVFDRVNTAGRPISRAQVFHALFASDTEPGSPATVVKELEYLHFGGFDENRVVQSLLALRGGDVQRDLHEEFGENEDPAEWYDLVQQALVRVIDFLRLEGVHHLLLMPNTLPVPVLAAFFHLHPEPEPWIRRMLSRWLWRGWVHGFGREGGQTPTLRRAVRSVNPQKGGVDIPSAFNAAKSLLEFVSNLPAPELRLDDFRTDKAFSRLVLVSLAALRPMTIDRKPVDVAHEYERHGARAVTELVPAHRQDAAARGFWPAVAGPPTGHESPDVLVSHAISAAAADKLRLGDIAGFLTIRRQDLAQQVRSFLESRLDRDSIIRPPLSELIVADDDGES